MTEPPTELPAPARYRVLPEIEAAVAVRSGPAASIFPMVYQDLARWIEEHGYQPVPGPGREVWVHDKDEITDPGPQVLRSSCHSFASRAPMRTERRPTPTRRPGAQRPWPAVHAAE